jgi:hypothetical protein
MQATTAESTASQNLKPGYIVQTAATASHRQAAKTLTKNHFDACLRVHQAGEDAQSSGQYGSHTVAHIIM